MKKQMIWYLSLGAVACTAAFYYFSQMPQSSFATKPQSASVSSFLTNLSPTPLVPVAQTSDVITPDGKAYVHLEKKPKANEVNFYSLSVTDGQKQNPKPVYTSTLPAGCDIHLPANSWSPDNKLFFVTITGQNCHTYLVFRADGTPWNENETYYDIEALFQNQKTDFTLTGATGWAANTLVIITTKNADGTIGPKYWFDTSSHSFIRLWR